MNTEPPLEPREQLIPVAQPVTGPPPGRDYEYVDDEDDERLYERRPLRARRPQRLSQTVRILLAVMAVGFTVVFIVAACLRPYDPDTGEPLKMATHTQLGLEPCNMVKLTGKPCPACGMTTSFALLMHGDILASLRANWVGTLIALFWLLMIPWSVVAVIRGRMWGIRNGELAVALIVGGLVALMIGRWAVIMMT